ncbi:MAG: hypothetical protein AAGE01_19145, partial [Pseudomonadota bacterium]
MQTRRFELMGVLLLASSGCVEAEEPGPLAGFEAFVGEAWHLEGSHQALSWGPGRRSVTAKSWFVIDGQEKEVSTGLWYWDPAREVIRGVFVATDMPV